MSEEITMIYDGIDMSDLLTVKKVIRTVGNKRNVEKTQVHSLGEVVSDVYTEGKQIEVIFSLASFRLSEIRFVDTTEYQNIKFGNINKIRETISGIFNKGREGARLYLSDEPDRYYIALVEDEIKLEGIQTWYDEATVTFFVPDGVAHSRAYKRVIDYQDDGKKLIFTLQNNGNVDALPIITIQNNSENGWVGLVNQTGVQEVGNRLELDGKVVEQSEPLLDFRKTKLKAGFSSAVINQGITNDPSTENQTGTFGWDELWGRSHLRLADRGTVTAGSHGVASATWRIPNDSNGDWGSLNDYLWWRQIFWLGSANQFGFMKVSVLDTDRRFMYGVETFKRKAGLECEYNFVVDDGGGGYSVLKKWAFKGTHKDADNPFNSTRGWTDIKRIDDVVQVYWWGAYPRFTVPSLKGRKSGYVTVTFGGYFNLPMVTHMYLDEFLYQKDKVQGWDDIPNRYQEGSIIQLNNEENRILINNLPKMNELVHGSQFITIPPGQSEVEVYYSEWAQPPTVNFNFEERWI